MSPSGQRNFEPRGRCSFVAFLLGFTRVNSTLMLAVLLPLAACAPKVSAGAWACPPDGGASNGGASNGGASNGGASNGGASNGGASQVPFWFTGFEDTGDPLGKRANLGVERFGSFCDYIKVSGYCYGDEPYVVVTEPRHSGHFAAEFKVIGDADHQTRCVHQGELPQAAYYGAWYYIAKPPNDKAVWNLWHFQGGDDPDSQRDLWDVSLANGAQPGDWELMVLDRPSGFENYRSADHVKIPIGTWFHIELFLKRASDSTGEIALYQDGVLLFDKVNLRSSASKFTQWYVGDWADISPPENSSLYVDDISISAALGSTGATP